MYDESDTLGDFFKVILGAVVVLIVIGAIGYAIWYVSLRADTSMQPVRRDNINHQAEQQIANNGYLHTLLSDIETDKSAVVQDRNQLAVFCQTHGSSSNGTMCKGKMSNMGYNDRQEYDRYTVLVSSDLKDMSDLVNKYNQYFANKDVVGVDSTLPKHVNPDGSYTDVDGTFKEGVK